jgi:hypothetical protein
VLTHDQHGQFNRLLVVEAWIDCGFVRTGKVVFGEIACAPKAFSDVLAGELKVRATKASTAGGMNVEGAVELAANVLETTRLHTDDGRFCIAVHGVAAPQHARALALHRLDQRRQVRSILSAPILWIRVRRPVRCRD